jgi:hypothetical protein
LGKDILLGATAMDTATGITGTVTGTFQDLDGVDRAKLEYVDKNGIDREFWVNIGRLEVLEPISFNA